MKGDSKEMLDILQKWEFLYGQKSIRKSWPDKTEEEQDRDIQVFLQELNKVVMFVLDNEKL